MKHLRKTHPTHYQTIDREINHYLIKKTPIYKKKNVLLRKFLRDTTNQQHKRTLTQWSQRIKHREYTDTTDSQRVSNNTTTTRIKTGKMGVRFACNCVSNNTTTTRIKTCWRWCSYHQVEYQTIPQQQGLRQGSSASWKERSSIKQYHNNKD